MWDDDYQPKLRKKASRLRRLRQYIAALREDVTALGVKPATPPSAVVVEFMSDIIRTLEDLIEKRLCLRESRRCFTSVWKNLITMPS